jgi:hypothetical protein
MKKRSRRNVGVSKRNEGVSGIWILVIISFAITVLVYVSMNTNTINSGCDFLGNCL